MNRAMESHHSVARELRLIEQETSLRILLAEDDAEMRRLLALVLRRDGHQVVEARDGGELLEALDAAMSMSMSMSAPASRRQVRGDKAAPIRAWSSKHAPETLVAGAGGLTILAAFALLFWTLGSGATPRLGPGEEMALASTNHAPVGGRVRRLAIGSAVTNPWIIPISSPEHPADAALLASCVPSAVPQRRSRATRACSMSINSVPWSEVWIDGASTGRHTPFVDYPIPCGRHRVEFKRQDLQIDQRESVVVEPNEPFKQRFTLAQEIE